MATSAGPSPVPRAVVSIAAAAVGCPDSPHEHGHRSISAKDLFDWLAACLLLFGLAPALIAIAAAVKLSSPGPVLFKQERRGRNGAVFCIFKFRTMRAECEDRLAERQTERNDARVTKVGHVLRRTSMDELPQLLNVLRGEMSLVGPRPHALGMTIGGRTMAELVPAYPQRYRVKPGMTGLAQINGFRGPLDTAEHLAHRIRWDLEYVSNRSLLLDLRIIARTAFKVANDPNAC